MAIKKKLTDEEYEGLPEYMKDSYKKSADGGYALDGVEGFVEKKRFEEFRENNKSLQSQIDALMEKTADFTEEDVEELRRLRQEKREMEEKDLIERGEIDQIMETRMKPIVTAHQKALKERDDKIASQSAHLDQLLIRDKAAALAVKAGIAGEDQMKDLIRRVRDEFKVVDGRAVRVDDKGEVVYGDSGSAMELDESYMEGVKTSAAYLFHRPEGSGADPRGGNRRGAQNTEHMTSAQKISAGLEERGLA